MLRHKKALPRDASLFAEPVEGTKAVECVVEANSCVSHRDEGGTLAFFEAWDAQAALVFNTTRRAPGPPQGAVLVGRVTETTC